MEPWPRLLRHRGDAMAQRLLAGRLSVEQALAAAAGSVLLWALYFTLGFRAFSRGLHANGLGMLLTVGLPLLVLAADRLDWPGLAKALPPGMIYGAAADSGGVAAAVGAVIAAGVTIATARRACTMAMPSCGAGTIGTRGPRDVMRMPRSSDRCSVARHGCREASPGA